MEGTFGKIRNFFADGIFGNIVRFLFDKLFKGIFTNNINFSNIVNLKNCHFKDLNLDANKINEKAFKNSPFKLFSGKIGSVSIKFPSLNALLTESLEVRLDRLDVLLVMNDVDFSKAEQEVQNLLAKLNSGELLQNIAEENPSGSNGPEEFDVYKKIINRILFNIKLKVENVCLRIVSEKPYKEVRLPIAPCFMLKIGKVEIKKNYDESANNNGNVSMNGDSTTGPLNFAKHQDYSINIYGITMHMMSNYELNPEEYVGKIVDSKAEFPFTYPDESHPSTFFVCACKKANKKANPEDTSPTADMEPISIRINFSNDKSKSVSIEMPNIEVMFDFLKIKFLSKYVDKFMEWKRYLDYKKALQEQHTSPKKNSPKASPHVIMHARKGSFGIDLVQEPIGGNKPRVSEETRENRLATFGTTDNLMPNPNQANNKKIRIAGLDIDVDYFQKHKDEENQGMASENAEKEFNEMEGINEIVSEPFEMTAENLLDTSNVHINLKLKSMYVYFMKNCTAFLETEFKRWWLYGSEPQTDTQKSFNKKIPMSYFQLKLTNLNLSVYTKESQINIGFSSLKILDVARVDTPLRTKANPGSACLNYSTINKSRVPWDKSDIFHSFRFDKSMMSSALRMPDLKRNSSVDTNEQSMLFQSAMSDITKEFLQIREMRKQILDWDIDPKKEHFCVNVILKFNKTIKYSKDKKGSDSYKTVKYLEDSIIHCPLNSEPLIDDLREVQTNPTVRLNTKGGKITALVDFPSIYINFYMGIVQDINFLLHNASDSYKMCENWYREQNHNLIVKWDQELAKDTQTKEDIFLQKEKEAQCKEKVTDALEAFYKRQNQLLSLDVTVKTPLIKLTVNLENPKRDNSFCFCGFGSHYFPETIHYNKVFKKEFVVLEVSQLALKILKTSINEDFLQNNMNKKAVQLTTHTLFQSLDIYIPSKVNDENRVYMMKLLSIQTIHDDNKFIIPSIALTIYEDNSDSMLKPLGPSKYPQQRNEEEKSSFENHSPILGGGVGGKDAYTKYYDNHMNKNLIADSTYLRKLQEDSIISLDVTFPKFEINASKQSLEFLQGFSNDWISLMKDLNEKVNHMLEQERRIFSSILEIKKSPSSKVPPTTKISFYIEEAAVQVFQDEKVNQFFQQKIDSKKSKVVNFSSLGSSAILLDASFSNNNIMEKSFVSTPFQASELRYTYPRREFERGLYYAFKIMFRHIDSIIYKNPREVTDIIHLEVQDLLIVDRAQEKPYFGSFTVGTTAAERDNSREFFDEAREFDAQDCIAYKQSGWNAWTKPLGSHRTIKEPEAFIEWKNQGNIRILDNTHKSFEYKNKNVIRVGLLKNIRNGKPVMNVDACIGQIVLRSDFKLSFIEMFKDIAGAFEKKEKQENDLNQMRFDSSIDKKVVIPSQEEPQIIIQCSLENILIDINPYLSFDYCKTFGKVNYNIDPETLIPELKDFLFYSDTRSLIAIESLGLRLVKTGNSVQFDEFNLSSLDLFMRQQKGDSAFKENRVILRSREDNLFEKKFEELGTTYAFKSHPFYLSGVNVKFTGAVQNIQRIDLRVDKIEVNVYSDTIPMIEKHVHLLLCLIDKRKYKNNSEDEESDEEQKELEVPLSINSSKAAAAGGQQSSEIKPKDQIYMEDESIEIDREYFAPLDVNQGSIRRSQDDDDVEEIVDDDEESEPEPNEDAKSYELLDSMPNMSSTFVNSATVLYFDEDNIHDFALETQTTSKKITFRIGEIALRIYESFEFDSGPQVLELDLNLSHEDEFNEEGNPHEDAIEDLSKPIVQKSISQSEKSECIMVVFELFSCGLILFDKNPEQRTNLSWRASIALENFEILDCFKSAKKNEANCKILSKHQPQNGPSVKYTLLQSGRKNNEMVMFNTFNAIFECFENNGCQQKDLRSFVALHPLAVHFAKPHYNFIKLFQAKMKLKSPTTGGKKPNPEDDIINKEGRNFKENQKNKKPSDLFVSYFQIAPCEVKMNINLDIAVFNLDLLKNLKLRFPTIIVRGADSTDDLKKELATFYVGKAKSQLGQLVKDLPILRNIKNLTNATLNLFYSPYMNYRHSGNFLSGLKDGVVGFAGSVSNEGLNLFSFVTIIFDNMTNLTGIRGNRNSS